MSQLETERAVFADYTIIPIESMSGMMTEKYGNTRVANKEVVILNYTPPVIQSDLPMQADRKIRKTRKPLLPQQSTLLEELARTD